MADAELNSKLYAKMSAEQDKFRSWLMDQPPADILNHAVEYTVREDILMEMGVLELPDDQARALLASPDAMSDIYKTFSKMVDTGHMDVVRECIEDRAASLSMEQAVEQAARDAAIGAAGLEGVEAAQVGLTSLKDFRDSDIRRRSIWEPETLPKDDLRFIDSGYNEQFRLPNGGRIEVEYPDRTFSAPCEYIDDYHAYIGGEVYHMCQFAEVLERGGGVCRPEPVLDAEQAAWKIGWDKFLAVECGAGQWDYHLFDSQMAELKSGSLEVVGCSINEVRDMILAENKLGRRSMTPTDYGTLMDKAAARAEEALGEKRESVLGQLSALKNDQKDKPSPAPEKKHREESR